MKSKHRFETTIERSELMQKIKGVNTKPELLFRKALWAKGFRYRVNKTGLPGKPDIVLKSRRLIIFIDGEFWHGYKWHEKKPKIKANRGYWIPKIERNMQRDRENNQKLKELGYTVLRFWEHEIKKDLNSCIDKVLSVINP